MSERVMLPTDPVSAERSSADDLQLLASAGWHSVDHLSVERCAIDHVLVGPGGAFAIETKWANDPWHLTDGFFDDNYARRALAHSREGAARLGLLLRTKHAVRCDVTPLLVIWGPGMPIIDEPIETEGVLVVPGHLLPRTLAARPATLDANTVRAVFNAIGNLAVAGREPSAPRVRQTAGVA